MTCLSRKMGGLKHCCHFMLTEYPLFELRPYHHRCQNLIFPNDTIRLQTKIDDIFTHSLGRPKIEYWCSPGDFQVLFHHVERQMYRWLNEGMPWVFIAKCLRLLPQGISWKCQHRLLMRVNTHDILEASIRKTLLFL